MKLQTENVKTVGIPRKINAILLNIKINPPKLVNVCRYELATCWQNFMEIYITWVKISQNVLGGYFFDSHCKQTNWWYCQTMGGSGRGPQPLSWRHVGETSETWLQICRHSAVADQMDSCGCSWAVTRMLWSADKVYERNHCRTGPIQNDLTRKQNYNSKTLDDLTIALVPNRIWRKLTWTLKRKKIKYREVTGKFPTRRRKIWSRNWKK